MRVRPRIPLSLKYRVFIILGKYQVFALARKPPLFWELCHLLLIPSPFSKYPLLKPLELNNCENMEKQAGAELCQAQAKLEVMV